MQWLDYEKKYMKLMVMALSFEVKSIQTNIERTKASIGSHLDLPSDLKNSRSILSIRNYKYNC